MSSEPKRYTSKIPGRSIPEVFGRFEMELARQSSARGVKFKERKLSAEAMTNAIVLHFLALPPGERDSVIDRYVVEFEQLVNDDEQPAASSDDERFSDSEPVKSEKPARPRKKQA